MPNIALPLAVDARQIELTNINVYQPSSDVPIHIDSVRAQLSGSGSYLKLDQLEVVAPQAKVVLVGDVQTAANWPMDMVLNWSLQHPRVGDLVGSGTVAGNLDNLKVAHTIEGSMQLEAKARLSDVITAPSWNGDLSISIADSKRLSPALDGVPLALRVSSEGHYQDYRALAMLSFEHPDTGAASVDVTAVGTSESVQIKQAILNLPDSAAQHSYLEGVGEIQFANLQSDLQIGWNNLQWPVTADVAQARSPQGKLTLSGTPKDFALVLNGLFDDAIVGPLEIDLTGGGLGRKFQAEQLKVLVQQSNSVIRLSGDYDLDAQKVSVLGGWSDLRWPITGNAQYVSKQGELSVTGR